MTYLYGHQSEEIRSLQKALMEHGFDVGPSGADAGFGDDTEKAVKDAQAAFKLPVTGVVDQALLDALGVQPQPSQPKGNPMSGILGSIFSGLFGNLLNWQLVQGYIRSGLVALGGWIGLDGYVGHDGTTSIIGAVMVIIGVIFQALANNRKVQALAVVKAVDQHPDITVVPAADTSLGKPIVSVAK